MGFGRAKKNCACLIKVLFRQKNLKRTAALQKWPVTKPGKKTKRGYFM